MSRHLRMPGNCCKKVQKIGDDLTWTNVTSESKIPGGVPPMEIRKVQEGKKPAVLKKS